MINKNFSNIFFENLIILLDTNDIERTKLFLGVCRLDYKMNTKKVFFLVVCFFKIKNFSLKKT